MLSLLCCHCLGIATFTQLFLSGYHSTAILSLQGCQFKVSSALSEQSYLCQAISVRLALLGSHCKTITTRLHYKAVSLRLALHYQNRAICASPSIQARTIGLPLHGYHITAWLFIQGCQFKVALCYQ